MRKKDFEKKVDTICGLCETLDIDEDDTMTGLLAVYLFSIWHILRRLKWIWITMCGIGVLGVISLVHFW